MLSAKSKHRLIEIQNAILESIAYGDPLPAVAEALCRAIEQVAPGAICSVLAIDPAGRIRPIAAPSLPAEYSDALDGLPIGPCVGSCGTAAFRRLPVLVEDIEHDPLWAEYKDLALEHGLRACWSSPIIARGGRVIGTFALYFKVPRGPTLAEQHAVKSCVHVCAIALERAEVQTRIHELAFYDPLTGLPNRVHADDLLRRTFDGEAEGLGLLLIDIDKLKVTNDTLGHGVGDALIREVARRIASTVNPSIACRIGGDEFIVILDACKGGDALGAAARAILASMESPFEADGHTLVPHVTIGGALYGRDGSDIETLRQNADLALYDSKENGRGRFTEYTHALRSAIIRRAQRINDVEVALNCGRLVAHYQPIVRLDSGDIVGLEALARIQAADGSVISAGYFEEALREPRVACRLTERIMRQVAADMRRWLADGLPLQHVGINVSMPDFQHTDLPGCVDAEFGGAHPLFDHLVIEVTEAVLVGADDGIVAPDVDRLRAMGLRVALDDFGTGFASLTHLLTLPADVIKIDKSFVDRLGRDDAATVIVSALIDIATKLGMRIVAEGIETSEQAAQLHSLGCHLGQGFHYFRPASFEDTTRRLHAHGQHADRRKPVRRVA